MYTFRNNLKLTVKRMERDKNGNNVSYPNVPINYKGSIEFIMQYPTKDIADNNYMNALVDSVNIQKFPLTLTAVEGNNIEILQILVINDFSKLISNDGDGKRLIIVSQINDINNPTYKRGLEGTKPFEWTENTVFECRLTADILKSLVNPDVIRMGNYNFINLIPSSISSNADGIDISLNNKTIITEDLFAFNVENYSDSSKLINYRYVYPNFDKTGINIDSSIPLDLSNKELVQKILNNEPCVKTVSIYKFTLNESNKNNIEFTLNGVLPYKVLSKNLIESFRVYAKISNEYEITFQDVTNLFYISEKLPSRKVVLKTTAGSFNVPVGTEIYVHLNMVHNTLINEGE